MLTPDQRAFISSIGRFLDNWSLQDLRNRPEDATVLESSWWQQATQLGWTSLLVPESRGGGSISGSGLSDAVLVARELGKRVAPGPFIAAAVAASALSEDERHEQLLEQVLGGDALIVPATAEARSWAGTDPATVLVEKDGGLALTGVKEPVEAADRADFLLVSAQGANGVQQVLVPVDAPGVTLTRMTSLDLSRRFTRVELLDVVVDESAVVTGVQGAAASLERQARQANVLQCADTAGAIRHVFTTTRQYLDDRASFGRPLASYQALKHRMADLAVVLEAVDATVDAAAAAGDGGATNAEELAHVAKAFVGKRAPALVQDCVQLHGGIGLAWEHDLHLYLRRVTQNSLLLGTPGEHLRALAEGLGM